MTDLRAVWRPLQAAESLLVGAALGGRRQEIVRLREHAGLEAPDFALLLRLGFGFASAGLQLGDYLVRYPFSTSTALAEAAERLSAAEVLDSDGDRVELTARGRDLLRAYEGLVAAGTAELELASVATSEVEFLLAAERQIVDSLAADPGPILSQRLAGLHPDYGRRELWHHWPLAWTLIAAREDEERQVASTDALSPLAWFARQQLWRGRFAAGTPAELVAAAGRYAPQPGGEAEASLALDELAASGDATAGPDGHALTLPGAERCEAADRRVEEAFLARWPRLAPGAYDRVRETAAAMVAELGAVVPEPT